MEYYTAPLKVKVMLKGIFKIRKTSEQVIFPLFSSQFKYLYT